MHVQMLVTYLFFFFFPSSETRTIWTGAFGSSYISLLYFSPLLIVSITFISSGKLPWYTIETSSFQWGSWGEVVEVIPSITPFLPPAPHAPGYNRIFLFYTLFIVFSSARQNPEIHGSWRLLKLSYDIIWCRNQTRFIVCLSYLKKWSRYLSYRGINI